MSKQLKKYAFKPGQSGNPAGRPKGSRNKLAETFLADVYAEWETGGKQAIKKMAKDRPADFCRMVASLMPKELKVNENPFADLSDSELQAFIDLCRVMAEGTAPEDEADAPGLPHCNDGEAD